MAIEIKEVTKLYGEQKALDNVSLTITKGEIVGLLGPNGAGKSTLMKIITCFLPPTDGTVTFNGLSIYDDSLAIRKKIGYLPENNPLYYDMYVKEFLFFLAGIHKIGSEKRKRVDAMIQLTGLAPEVHKKIGALSKGFRQRVGIAQAMLHDPEFLILDEPTSGLDPNQLVEIRKLIKEIGKEKTILLSTHIMQEVEAICDRVVIINKGKIIADESADQLSTIIKGNDEISVEFDVAVDEQLLKAIKGIIAVRKGRGNTFTIETTGSEDIRAVLFQFAVDQGVKVLSLTKHRKTIEQVFQQLTLEK